MCPKDTDATAWKKNKQKKRQLLTPDADEDGRTDG